MLELQDIIVGYDINFSKITNLQKGDEIIYTTFNNYSKIYNIETITQINDDDWSYLEDTQDNRITIITCVKNKPNQRLLVQAIEESYQIQN